MIHQYEVEGSKIPFFISCTEKTDLPVYKHLEELSHKERILLLLKKYLQEYLEESQPIYFWSALSEDRVYNTQIEFKYYAVKKAPSQPRLQKPHSILPGYISYRHYQRLQLFRCSQQPLQMQRH